MPPKLISGVSTKVGTILISSKVLAYTPFIKPKIENSVDVNRIEKSVRNTLLIPKLVKNKLTKTTTTPTKTPLAMPPTINPRRIAQFAMGEISISSMAFWNFAPKNAEATLAYELVITANIINPGTINSK